MSNPHEEDELAATQTEGYKLSQKQSLQHYANLDQEDESLNKWKASLGITAGSTTTEPNVTILSLSLSSSDLAKPIEFNFPDDGANTKIDETKFPLVTIKEGVDYDVQVKFFVTGAVVSGLRYIQVAKRAGIKVDKLETMIGSYSPTTPVAPSTTPEAIIKKITTSESPSGMLARSGQYAVRSRFVDDDGVVYKDFGWSFKLAKEW